MNATRSPAPWLIAAAVVFFAGQLVPLPGLDHESVAELSQGGLLGLFQVPLTRFGIVSMAAASTLVLIQFVLILGGALERPWPRRIAAVVYVVASGLQGFALAVWAESANSGTYFVEIAPNPGWGFRGTLMLATMAGAAIVWWAFGRIDRTRLAHGAFFLCLISALQTGLASAFQLGADVALGQTTPLFALLGLCLPIALAVVGLALVTRPRRFPVALFGPVRLRSSWDALALPALATLPFAALAGGLDGATLGGEGTPTQVDLVGGPAALVVAIAFSIWWRRAADVEAGPRPRGAVALAVFSLAAGVFLMFAAFSGAGGIERAMDPGPLSGENRFTLVLEAEERFAPGDGDAMVERLRSLGATAEVSSSDERRITLDVEGSTDPRAVADALRPRRLEMRFARELEEDLYEGTIGVHPVRSYESNLVRGWTTACEETDYFTDDPPPHCVFAVGQPDAITPDGPCTVHCLGDEIVLDGSHIAAARVNPDRQTGIPVVALELTSDGAQRFGDATGAHLREVLAIVIDGEVISAPIVQSRIDGGRVQITLGSARDVELILAEANQLAAALRPGARISSEFVVVEESLR